MGVCFCKEKIEAEVQTSPQPVTDFPPQIPPNAVSSNRNSLTSQEFRWLSGCAADHHNHKLLSESVDKLVKETLDVIGKVVDK